MEKNAKLANNQSSLTHAWRQTTPPCATWLTTAAWAHWLTITVLVRSRSHSPAGLQQLQCCQHEADRAPSSSRWGSSPSTGTRSAASVLASLGQLAAPAEGLAPLPEGGCPPGALGAGVSGHCQCPRLHEPRVCNRVYLWPMVSKPRLPAVPPESSDSSIPSSCWAKQQRAYCAAKLATY